MICIKCKKQLPEEELDLHNGEWLCHDCEENEQKEVQAIETLRALDGKLMNVYKIFNYKIAAFSEKQAKFLLSKGIIKEKEIDVGVIIEEKS